MLPASSSRYPACRLIFVLDGTVEVTGLSAAPAVLHADDFAYAPAGTKHSLVSTLGCGLIFFERVYALKAKPSPQIGTTAKQPLVPVAPEIFKLRKLLPQVSWRSMAPASIPCPSCSQL